MARFVTVKTFFFSVFFVSSVLSVLAFSSEGLRGKEPHGRGARATKSALLVFDFPA